MKRALAALAALSFATAAQAAPRVEGAWTRPAALGGTGAGFMSLKNPDAKADALVAVETPLARTVQIHQSSMTGGMA
ncbi:MAG: copper chaperone PCu(A)C, partial [Alphaproteobacteria bacterium]|nr:copper chaperone PCu(A)C [Alphaproteobacteria bacterium]MBU1514267.1 copper chaperone PCu(A)C [Alphaproteobacteria bacterium]